MRRVIALFLLIISIVPGSSAQRLRPEVLTPSEIHQRIRKLGFLGTALYVAAHPDDENTRLISYLDNEVMATSTYLSLTRGDGGQNLIGPEIRELLGVIRTQELLMARSLDGGDQYFTRANDFGYSKHPDETMAIWDRQAVLSDVVRVIRQLHPDIIVNRFSAESAGETHGHHTASAILALEAFDLAGDGNAFPDQLNHLNTWQPRRIFFNTSWWFYGSQEAFDEADKSRMLAVDAGVYYPWLGKSNTEIAAESRSMHKCQGFGSTGTRGEQMEYLELLKGDMPKSKHDLFEGINTTWTRVKGGEVVKPLVDQLEKEFDFRHPEASIPLLFRIHGMVSALEDDFWRALKLKELEDLILACAGLYLEAAAGDQYVTPGETLEVKLEAINRSRASVKLLEVEIDQLADTTLDLNLAANSDWTAAVRLIVPQDSDYTGPYWLRDKGTLGMYKVDDPDLIGVPESPAAFTARFVLESEGRKLAILREVVYKFNDPENGETYRPLEIVPAASVRMKDKVLVFPDSREKEVQVVARADVANFSGILRLELPAGWSASPSELPVELSVKGEERSYTFKVRPGSKQELALVVPVLKSGNSVYKDELIRIDYAHIPFQTVLMPSEASFVRLDLSYKPGLVGYVEGAGDEIPQCLAQLGYEVQTINLANAGASELVKYPVIVMGVRAYNKLEELSYKHQDLMKYVEGGGTLIVQYNTNRGLQVAEPGPYPLKVSRDRVTVEEAEVSILSPEHPVMNVPNKIGAQDFDGWVQERGLYFPSEWDERYTAVLSSHDPGEPARDGGLLVAQHGKGYFVYTGYSWFRQLPAGVPGAYRLFTNLISLGNE